VILAITAGSLAFGLLGAFLAVPVAATIGRVINVLRGDTEEAEHDAGAAAAAPA
jgi:predicted PurR-regulated permease PerM